MRPFENLSMRQRRATPLAVCRWLVKRVKDRFGVDTVAVLWVERKSNYWCLYPTVELWGLGRDARTYRGPHPVICHPPCGPWGKYKKNCHESKEHGLIAIDLMHRYGGVIEHPVGSSLFAEYGRGGVIERFNQGDMGHQCLKPTLLYWADGDRAKDLLGSSAGT